MLELLDWEMYLTATSLAQPTTPDAVLATLAAERMIQRSEEVAGTLPTLARSVSPVISLDSDGSAERPYASCDTTAQAKPHPAPKRPTPDT